MQADEPMSPGDSPGHAAGDLRVKGADSSFPSFDRCIEVMLEMDRLGYLGRLVQGFVHNINGPLQNMSMLTEILLRGQEQMDAFVTSRLPEAGSDWREVSERQMKRFGQMEQQISGLAETLRDFMTVHEIERNEERIDLNLLLAKLASIFRADLFFKHQVELELRLERNLPMIAVPGHCLVPSFIHIIRNALIAMRNTPQKKLVIETAAEEGSVRTTFYDSGVGLGDIEGDENLFELFRSDWERCGPCNETFMGFGLFAVRKRLSPYGVSLELKNGPTGAVATLNLPTH